MKKIFFILFLCITNALVVKAQQPTLWQSLYLEFNYKPNVMCFDSIHNVSYIAGDFTKVGDSVCNIVEWDGQIFTLLPPSPLNWTLCMQVYHGKLYVGGGNGFASWDGHQWTSLGNNTTPLGDSTLAGVDCMISYHDSLLLGCYYYTGDGNEMRPSVSFWDGNSLTDLYRVDTILGTSGWSIKSMVYYKGDLYISGNINVLSPLYINEIARFDGTRWTDVGNFQDGNLDDIRKLLVWKDTLYAAGAFEEANGSPGNGIAKWDGQNWHRLNDGVWQAGGPGITDIMIFNDELYATGWFNWVDGIQQGVGFHGFAKWDGSRWCTLGTTADNVIFTMGRFRDSLYIMGGFDSLNNQPMRYMAKWIGGDYTDSCSQPTTGIGNNNPIDQNTVSIYPNPVSGFLHIRYHSGNNQKQKASIRIADLSGRVMQTESRRMEPGGNFFQLDVSKLAPGMYFLTVVNGQEKSVVKFVKQ